MATNRAMLKEAIADAKAVKETAIANAKAALEEAFTPQLKSMLSLKLQEMELEEEETYEALGTINDPDTPTAHGNVAEDEDKMMEVDLEELLAELNEEEGDEVEEGEGENLYEAEEGEEEGEEEEGEEEEEETVEVADMTVEELKDLIKDIVAQEMGGGEEMMDMGAEAGEEAAGEEEEINLDELLAELDSVEEGKEKVEEKKEEEGKKMEEAKKEEVEEAKKEAKKAKEDLEEAIKVIKFLKKELNEVNLLNAKNTYVNKIFKAKSLSESQKVNVLKSMDKATNVKEAKVIYESLVSTLSTTKKTSIKESVGFASKAAGVAPKQPIVESDAAIRRMQQLAGIIK